MPQNEQAISPRQQIDRLVKIYGMEVVLEKLIDNVAATERVLQKQGKGELIYLRLLSVDLEHTLNNYKKREEQ